MIDLELSIKAMERKKQIVSARRSLASFVEFMTSDFPQPLVPARHHRIICESLEKTCAELGKVPHIQRLMIMSPPGSAKSTYSSEYFVAWYLGHYPTHRVISVSHTSRFATKIGGKVREVMRNPKYSIIFPDVSLADDDQGKGAWSTNKGGTYMSTSIGGGISGERAELIVIDDPFPQQSDADSITYRDTVWTFYKGDLERRLNGISRPIVLINTRFHIDDLSGRLLDAERKGGDKWVQVSFEAICEHPETDPLGRQFGEALWPEWQPIEDMKRIRDDPGTPKRIWESQYQQRPTIEGGNILRREAWRVWTEPKFPQNIEAIVCSLDSASKVNEQNDFSAFTAWGVFRPPNAPPPEWDDIVKMIRYGKNTVRDAALQFRLSPGIVVRIRNGEDIPRPKIDSRFDIGYLPAEQEPKPASCILMHAWRERYTFPELRRIIADEWSEWYEKATDSGIPLYFLIEDKSSGIGLIQELQSLGISVTPILPERMGNKMSKVYRAQMMTGVLDSGCVYALGAALNEYGEVIDKRLPEFQAGPRSRYARRSDILFRPSDAEMVVSQCEKFPQDGRDITDTCVMAWWFMRNVLRCFVLEDDADDEDDHEPKQRERYVESIY